MKARVSSSISNWREKISKRYGLQEVYWPIFGDTIFFGLYHVVDYLRFVSCQGRKKVFWAGSDILALEKTWLWKRIIPRIKAEHLCENYVEQDKLKEMGIESVAQPIFLSKIPEISYWPSERVDVYTTMRPGSEVIYGSKIIEELACAFPDFNFHIYGVEGTITGNIFYHGKVSEEEFNADIQNYHACLRLNEFDGFGDALAKSVLMGQWPISIIAYPHIKHASSSLSLVSNLKDLRTRLVPNYEARNYWLKELSKNIV